MTQEFYLSGSGMFYKFKQSRVIRTADLNYGNFLRALDTIKEDAVFYEDALAIVEKTQKVNGGRVQQQNILKAVLVSEKVYSDALLAFPALVPLIDEVPVVDDFFLKDDRFSRALAAVAPHQERVSKDIVVGAGGILDTVSPFVDATFHSSLPYTGTLGIAAQAFYALGFVGQLANVSFVTFPRHKVLLVKLQKVQTVTPTLPIANETIGVVMSGTLAGFLGITLPPY
jgi:hypothetical protein